MKLLRTLLFGKPAGAKKPEKQKKNLLLTLLDKLGSFLLGALEKRWNDQLWKQDN